MDKNRESTKLKVISDVSHAIIIHKENINSLLQVVLDVLQEDMGLRRATLTLKRDDLLVIEASKGLTEKEHSRGLYRLGEGITGKVGETGKSIVISDITKNSSFLDRTKARRSDKISFICVPIMYEEEVIGTLSIDCPPSLNLNLLHTQQLLEIVANLLADGVALLRNELEEKETLRAENLRLRKELESHFRPKNIIGNCNSMKAVYGMIGQVASSLATVLIRGESGTGKELIAKAIHYASPRKQKPFIAVNCAALPENLIESELFGHEKGSFTGANIQRKGRFEVADGGTLFLDEIGDISISVQVKLLRVLQERVFERVGGHTSIKADVRIIAATSRNLEENMSVGKFREDLFYRLNIFPIHMPSLKERKTDIILLADYFLEKYNRLYFKQIKRISSPAINMLMAYHWPGNVRELENCIERAVLVSGNEVINAYDLPPSLQTAKESKTPILGDGKVNFMTLVESFEKELIVEALKEHNGNVAAATRKLGVTQRIIHYKIEKLKIAPKQYKDKR
ncbi:MAG: GAF domain-containing protein [bacterium]|nr:GAF domain-containing protein [bacterium]